MKTGRRTTLTQIIGVLTALATAAALVVLPDPAGAQPADGILDLGGAVTVHPTVEHLIAADGTAEAIVTTWDRRGLADVSALGIEGGELRHLPMVLVPELNAVQLEALRTSPAVRSVYPNEEYELHMQESSWTTGARQVWEGLDGTDGVLGTDIEVAVIDTGGMGRHIDFGNLIEFCDTTTAAVGDDPLGANPGSMGCSPHDPDAGNAGPAGPFDDARDDAREDYHHGTHVAGTIAGTGLASGGVDDPHATVGIAPEAKIRAYKANIGPSLLAFQILTAFDDITYKKVNGFNDVVAINNSWGGGAGNDHDPEAPQAIAFEAAYDAGIVPVFSAGNAGPDHNTLGVQCTSPFVVCVGATTKSDQVVMFSSRGRPAAPADTDHDGEVGGRDDAFWGNHDRELAMALHASHGVGLYRPTLVAPGAAINAMDQLPTCFEESPDPQGCYVALQGTSMSAPHVSGAIALIADAYQQAHGELPTPRAVIEILESSAALNKVPGWAAEEQGAGALNLPDAVRMARSYPGGLAPVNLGTPPAPYAEGLHPGAEGTVTTQAGCTTALSWDPAELPEEMSDFPEPPPQAVAGAASHTVVVPEDAERLRVTADWSSMHPGANLYVRMWRPGIDPAAEAEDPGPERAFPDQEFANLVYTEFDRSIDVRAPEPGEWTVTVYHRAGGAALPCSDDAEQHEDIASGFNYDLLIEIPRVATQPTAEITDADVRDGWIDLAGGADYPQRWDGVTHWEVWDSGYPDLDLADRTRLHMRGNLDTGCTGVGNADVDACDGPFLLEEEPQSPLVPARWEVPVVAAQDDGTDRNNTTPNWVWEVDEPTTVSGPMTVNWWAECPGCSPVASAAWWIRLWADGELVVERRMTRTPLIGVPTELSATIDVPTATAEETFVVQLAPHFVDTQNDTTIYYDSALPCGLPGGDDDNGDGIACDSYVDLPVDSGITTDVRVTDLPDEGLRVAWSELPGVTSYTIHRSDSPDFEPSSQTAIVTTSGVACDSPDVPGWPTASRDGLCYLDTDAPDGVVSYYRIVAGSPGDPASLLAYGTPTSFDRQVKARVDRIFGPGYWEVTDLDDAAGTDWSHAWDTRGIEADADDAVVRSFTQGVGSAPAALDAAPAEETTPLPTTGGGGTSLIALLALALAGAFALGRRRTD